MRFAHRALMLVTLVWALAFAGAAQAGWGHGKGVHHKYAPSGWGHVQPLKRWVYRPRYKLHTHADPYRYQYKPRGYYPYYNSGYWRPRHKVLRRYHFRAPRYYQAWGAPRRHYHHRRWHRRHHGGHKKGHW